MFVSVVIGFSGQKPGIADILLSTCRALVDLWLLISSYDQPRGRQKLGQYIPIEVLRPDFPESTRWHQMTMNDSKRLAYENIHATQFNVYTTSQTVMSSSRLRSGSYF